MRFTVHALVAFFALTVQPGSCQLPQRTVLEIFYNATNGPNWTDNAGWLDDAVPECEWVGVECGSNALVTELNRRDIGLDGTIPTELGDLTYLTSLSFSARDDKLVGTIPTEIAELAALQILSLSYCSGLNGTIPNAIVSLPQLTSLSLAYSAGLTGTIPTEIGLATNLKSVSFNSCEGLTGSLPTEIGLLTNVFEFIVPKCTGMSGPIPSEIGNMSALYRLFLGYGGFTGTIPMEMENLAPTLEGSAGGAYVELQGNELEGTVPEAICNVGRLNNGNVAQYGCDAVACRVGSFQNQGADQPSGDSRGKAYSSSGAEYLCQVCPAGQSTPFLGSVANSCTATTAAPAAPTSPTEAPVDAPTEAPTSAAASRSSLILMGILSIVASASL